jgi:hypothetical protein
MHMKKRNKMPVESHREQKDVFALKIAVLWISPLYGYNLILHAYVPASTRS